MYTNHIYSFLHGLSWLIMTNYREFKHENLLEDMKEMGEY